MIVLPCHRHPHHRCGDYSCYYHDDDDVRPLYWDLLQYWDVVVVVAVVHCRHDDDSKDHPLLV